MTALLRRSCRMRSGKLLRAREDDCAQKPRSLTWVEHESKLGGRKSMLGEKEVSRVRTPWMQEAIDRKSEAS